MSAKVIREHAKNYAKCKAGYCLEEIEGFRFARVSTGHLRPEGEVSVPTVNIQVDNHFIALDSPDEILTIAMELIKASQSLRDIIESRNKAKA